MRIQRISVSNLRGIELAVVEPQQLTYLLGHNGEGKSTIVGALKWALMGWLPWTDKKGSGADGLIRHGHKSAVVEVVADEFRVKRELGKAKSVTVDGATGKDAEARLLVDLPRAEVLDCMLTPVAFTALAPKAQQDILFSLVDGSGVDAAWVRGKLSEPEAAALNDDLATILTGQSLFEVLHKSAYDQRTKANGKRDALRKVLEAATGEGPAAQEPAPAESGDAVDIEALQAAARDAGQVYLDASTAAKSAETKQQAHSRAAAQVEQARVNLVRSQEVQRNHTQPAHEEVTAEAVQALDAARGAAQGAMEKTRGDLANMRGNLNALSPQVEKFAAGGDEGPCLVLSTVACPLSAEQRADAIAQARAQIADLRSQESALSTQVEQARKAAEAAEVAHRDAQQAAQAWAGYRQRAKDLAHDTEQWGNALEQAQAALEQAAEPDTEALQAALDLAKLDLDLANAALKEATGLQARREARATASAVTAANTEADLTDAEQEWRMLDALVKRLEPQNLPAEANRDLVGGVLEQVNEALGAFTDFELDCEPGVDFRLLVARNGQTTPVSFLSTSEQYRVGVACQVAFALLTEFGVVVMDGADVLDHQSPMAAMLYRSGVQAIVAATMPRDKVEPGELPTTYPRGPGIASYWVSGGTEERGKATLLTPTEQREAA